MGVYRKRGAWWIDWYEGRRRLRKKTPATTRTEAKKLLEKVRAKMLPRDLGLFDPKLKCAELVTRYLEVLKGTRAKETWRRAFHSLRNFFFWCPVGQVRRLTPELCQRYAAHRRDEGASITTVNMEIGALKTCCNWGVQNRLIPVNPVALARKLKGGSKGRLRFLSEDEIRSLLQAARGTVYHDIFYTLIRTGMRKGELIHLRWEDVDFEQGQIRTGGHSDEHGDDDTKTHAERHVPMDSDLAEIIARQSRLPGCAFVFPTERGTVRENNLYRELERHARKAGIGNVNLHTLRHTFASHLVMNGVDLASVKELLGHSTIQMTMRYAHLARSHLRAAVEKFKVPSFRESPRVSAGPGFKRTETA